MRKNKLMRAAAGLMVATLLTTSIISGTLAKYTVSKEADDTARVAKFGVAINAAGTTFANSYVKDDESATTVTNSVASTSKVIAPGTNGKMAGIQLTGTPEVAVKVSYKGEFSLNDNWTVDGAFYCPLEIKINSDTIKGTDYNKASDFVNAVNSKIDAYSQTYEPGKDLSTVDNSNLAITWAWNFDKNDDAKDTKLGDATNAGTVTLKVTTTVTQID